MLFLGDDWAEAHHDIELQDRDGRVLVRRRLPEGVVSLGSLPRSQEQPAQGLAR